MFLCVRGCGEGERGGAAAGQASVSDMDIDSRKKRDEEQRTVVSGTAMCVHVTPINSCLTGPTGLLKTGMGLARGFPQLSLCLSALFPCRLVFRLTQVVRAELHLKPVLGSLSFGDGHNPCVVDQNVERFGRGRKSFGEGSHALERREVQGHRRNLPWGDSHGVKHENSLV